MRSRRLQLPDANIKRWTALQKAAVVQAVRGGVLTLEQACERYKLSEEEFRTWERNFDQHGVYGLQAKQVSRKIKGARRPT